MDSRDRRIIRVSLGLSIDKIGVVIVMDTVEDDKKRGSFESDLSAGF